MCDLEYKNLSKKLAFIWVSLTKKPMRAKHSFSNQPCLSVVELKEICLPLSPKY